MKTATVDPEFTLYFEEIKAVYENFIKFIFAVSLSILTAIGWFLGKTTALTTLHSILMYACLVLVLIVEFAIMRRTRKVFKTLETKLNSIGEDVGIDIDLYRHRSISWGEMLAYYLFHIVLMVILQALVQAPPVKA